MLICASQTKQFAQVRTSCCADMERGPALRAGIAVPKKASFRKELPSTYSMFKLHALLRLQHCTIGPSDTRPSTMKFVHAAYAVALSLSSVVSAASSWTFDEATVQVNSKGSEPAKHK